MVSGSLCLRIGVRKWKVQWAHGLPLGKFNLRKVRVKTMKLIFEKLNHYFYRKWHLAVLDMDAGLWVIESKASNIPYLKAQNAKGRHILLQPEPVIESYYLLVDDLTWPMILSHHHYPNGGWKPGRMVVETSPGNYQVWIHSSRRLSLIEKRYWLKKLCSDPGADPNNRWGRCPGFRNRKDKYRDPTGGYPLAKLIWIDWRGKVEIPHSNNEISSSCGKREQGKKDFKDSMNPDKISGKTSIPFPPPPQAGACVVVKTFFVLNMQEAMNLLLTFHMPLLWPEEDILIMRLESVLFLNVPYGKIILEREE